MNLKITYEFIVKLNPSTSPDDKWKDKFQTLLRSESQGFRLFNNKCKLYSELEFHHFSDSNSIFSVGDLDNGAKIVNDLCKDILYEDDGNIITQLLHKEQVDKKLESKIIIRLREL